MNVLNAFGMYSNLTQANRPIRLRLSHQNSVLDDLLLVKRVAGQETLCGGIEYRLFCVSNNASLPLKDFIALPAELQFVTDRGQLRSVCGIVAQASAGQSDGGLATYQLVLRDALSLMEQRINTRVYRNQNEVDISTALAREWRERNPILAKVFDVDVSGIKGKYPAREFTMQHNESDAAFCADCGSGKALPGSSALVCQALPEARTQPPIHWCYSTPRYRWRRMPPALCDSIVMPARRPATALSAGVPCVL